MSTSNWLVLAATVSWGIWAFTLRMAMNDSSPLSIQIAYTAAGLLLIPGYWLLARFWKEPIAFRLSGSLWAAAAAVFVGIGIVALLYVMREQEASQAVALTATYPVFTMILAVAFLGESFTITRLCGVVAIAVGAYLVSR